MSAGWPSGIQSNTSIGIIPEQIPECLPVCPSHSQSHMHRRQCAGEAWPNREQARHCQGNSLPRTFSRACINWAGVWMCCFQRRHFYLRFFQVANYSLGNHRPHILTLEKIRPTFAQAVKHSAIGKQVLVTKGFLKGIIGYVVAHNYVLNDFIVNLVSHCRTEFLANNLVYLLVFRLLFMLIILI